MMLCADFEFDIYCDKTKLLMCSTATFPAVKIRIEDYRAHIPVSLAGEHVGSTEEHDNIETVAKSSSQTK